MIFPDFHERMGVGGGYKCKHSVKCVQAGRRQSHGQTPILVLHEQKTKDRALTAKRQHFFKFQFPGRGESIASMSWSTCKQACNKSTGWAPLGLARKQNKWSSTDCSRKLESKQTTHCKQMNVTPSADHLLVQICICWKNNGNRKWATTTIKPTLKQSSQKAMYSTRSSCKEVPSRLR